MEEPLLTLPTTTASAAAAAAVDDDDDDDAYAASTPRILIRIFFVAAVAVVSLWAHREASRGFGISVVVADPRSPAGRRFALAFASNGRAERLVHRAGRLAHRALYPDTAAFPPKPVRHVTLLAAAAAACASPASSSSSSSSSSSLPVGPGARPEEYVIHLDPSVLMTLTPAEADAAVSRAVRRAVARVLMWDPPPPEEVADAVADYAASAAAEPTPSVSDVDDGSAGAACWSEGFVRYCEARRAGFVARLNREARARWSERAVESALGEPLERACAAYRRRRGAPPQSAEPGGARSTSASHHATSAL